MPEISVIMPSFNSALHITCAIESVLCQTFDDFDLIVVDGGSKDGTKQIVEKIALSDKRVVLIENKNDNGPAHARYTGIKASNSKFVAFLDADDYWREEKLFLQHLYMCNNDIEFSYSDYYLINQQNKYTHTCIYKIKNEYDFNDGLCSRGIGTLTVMIRKNILTDDVMPYKDKIFSEDFLWWMLILKKGITAYRFPARLAYYRIVNNSRSKNYLKNQMSVWKIYRKYLSLSLIHSLYAQSFSIVHALFKRIKHKICTNFVTLLQYLS